MKTQGQPPAAGEGNDLAEKVDPITRAVDLILADGAELVTEFNYLTRVRRRVTQGHPRIALNCRVSSGGTTAWIARLLYEARLPQLSPREESQVLRVLEGMALENYEPMDLPDTVEDDPVGYMIGYLLKLRPTWSGTATELRGMLIRMGCQSDTFGVDHPGWPKSAAMLTRRLGELAGLLADMGIVHETRRDGWRRTHTLRLAGAVTATATNSAAHAVAPQPAAIPPRQTGASTGRGAPFPASSHVSSLRSSFVSPPRNGASAAHDDNDDVMPSRQPRNSAASVEAPSAQNASANSERNGRGDKFAPALPAETAPLSSPDPATRESSQESSRRSSFVSSMSCTPCRSRDDSDDESDTLAR